MRAPYTIVLARPRDLAVLPAIETAATVMFEGHGLDDIPADSTDPEEFAEAQASGRLWVALVDDVPVGFALVELLPSGAPHLEEIDVHPWHGRRGIGRALVEAVCHWTALAGHRAITLTTFRDLPWNMPFYARLGFEEWPQESLAPELAAVVRDEASRGLDPKRRVVMRNLLKFG